MSMFHVLQLTLMMCVGLCNIMWHCHCQQLSICLYQTFRWTILSVVYLIILSLVSLWLVLIWWELLVNQSLLPWQQAVCFEHTVHIIYYNICVYIHTYILLLYYHMCIYIYTVQIYTVQKSVLLGKLSVNVMIC